METIERVDHPAAPDDDAPHLLVVDDDTRIRNLLKQYLTENGFRVRRLSDGEILPVEFAEGDLRKESRRNDFWWM